MTAKRIAIAAACLALFLAACQPEVGSVPDGGEDDRDGTTLDVHVDPEPGDETGLVTIDDEPGVEGWMTVLLSVEADEETAAEIQSELAKVSDEIQSRYEPGWLDIDADAGRTDEINRCFFYALPGIGITYDPEATNVAALIEILEASDLVVSIDAPGVDTTEPPPDEQFEGDGEDEMIECEERQLWVYLDRELVPDPDGLRDRILEFEPVIAVASERSNDEFFVPDLSQYPDLEACYPDMWANLTVVFEEAQQSSFDLLIGDLENVPGVVGFGGPRVDPVLDPILESEEEIDWQRCEGVEGSVRLEADISDEEAAVVVARAVAIEGVADTHLRLVDPDDIEPCPETSDPEVHYDCFIPTSELTIYRGDQTLATPELIAAELCDLPGVLSMSVYDRESDQEFADPFETCGELRLEVVLDRSIPDGEARSIAQFALAMEGVDAVDGPWFGDDYEILGQDVEIGELDANLCLNTLEANPRIILTLRRMNPDEALEVAAEVAELEEVVDVQGNAIRRSPSDPKICGFGALWIRIGSDMAEKDRDAMFGLLESRGDVIAVVVGEPYDPGEGDIGGGELGQDVEVKFEEVPPDAIEELAADIRRIAGVREVDVNNWLWETVAG